MAAIDEFLVYYYNPATQEMEQKLVRAESTRQAAVNIRLAHPDWEIDAIECSDVTPEGWLSRYWQENN